MVRLNNPMYDYLAIYYLDEKKNEKEKQYHVKTVFCSFFKQNRIE